MLDVIIGSEGSMVHKSRVAKDSSLVDLPSPETNMATENWPSQKESSIPTIHFQVPC